MHALEALRDDLDQSSHGAAWRRPHRKHPRIVFMS
jgi:hypothetical protein